MRSYYFNYKEKYQRNMIIFEIKAEVGDELLIDDLWDALGVDISLKVSTDIFAANGFARSRKDGNVFVKKDGPVTPYRRPEHVPPELILAVSASLESISMKELVQRLGTHPLRSEVVDTFASAGWEWRACSSRWINPEIKAIKRELCQTR